MPIHRLHDNEFIQVWSVLRKNKMAFIFYEGILMLGFPFFALGWIIKILFWNEMQTDLASISINLLVGIAFGASMGWGIYNSHEKRIEALLKKSQNA